MPKSLKDILAGVKQSNVSPGSTGKAPGVDYMPKAGDEQEFVAKHEVEKHEDRVGNGDDIYNATNVKYSLEKDEKHGHKSPKDKKVYDKKSNNKISESIDINETANAPNREKMIKDLRALGHEAEWDLLSTSKLHNHWQKKTNKNQTVGNIQKESKLTCNMTEEGTFCPIHENSSCMGTSARQGQKKQLREIAKKKMTEKINYTSGTMRNPVPAVTMDPGLGRS